METTRNDMSHRLVFFLRQILAVLSFVFLSTTSIVAEKLPLKFYTSADGLTSDVVSKIVADSRGFLWFCTTEGLSRFDGYTFKNYTQEDGLPHREIYDFLETKDGTYLIATPKGLAVFDPLGKSYRWNIIDDRLEQNSGEPPLFKTYLPNDLPDRLGAKNIYSIAQDGNGNIYATTKYGLYRFVKIADDWQFQRFTVPQFETDKVEYFGTLFADSRGDVWLGVDYFVYRILKTGEVQKISEPGSNGFFEDKDGNIWVNPGGHKYGIRVFSIQNDHPVLKTRYTKKDGLFTDDFSVPIAQERTGRIFVSSNGRLFEFVPDAKGNEVKFRFLEKENIHTAINMNGAIWLAFNGNGVGRYSPNSFYTFDKKDGLPDKALNWIFGNKNGEVFLTMGHQNLVRVSDEKIESISLRNIKERYWTNNFLDLQSQDGEFWLSSLNGLLRYPKLSNFLDINKTAPKKIYRETDGLFSNTVTGLFEDSRGDVWFSALTSENTLLRWERSTQKTYRYTFDYGLPKASGPISFGEDAAGNIWIGYYFGQIVRYKNGKFQDLTAQGLIQNNSISQFMSDKQGRFWLATSSRGLFYLDDPNAETPIFNNFSTANGLSSNQVNCVIKDNFGNIYAGTGRGINRIEPDLRRIKIFTQNDGLPGNVISKCYADVMGNLWFSWVNSLIKFTPEEEGPSPPPPIFIGGLSVNGKPHTISELGVKEIKALELASDERQIRIDYFAISFDAGETLRYQYKVNDQEWSEPNERRTVDLNLSPGTYDFAVRAISAKGSTSENSATMSMTIARPIWQRWWFIAFAILAVGSIILAFVRYRLKKIGEVQTALEALNRSRAERLAELHRVRTRIATDLHDDIGSSLSQISLYSELARQREREQGIAGEQLDVITNVANELVETMSDIVWAINPTKDHLPDLTQRMRRFAANILTAKEIDMEFYAPDPESAMPLGANIRREVFLIFKETVNNIAKHSDATEAKIRFSLQDDRLVIDFEDNGKGFEQSEKLGENGHTDWRKFRGGNGLLNMRKRAAELGGAYEVRSEIGKGTTVILSIPLEITT